jgi:hypothetical protein
MSRQLTIEEVYKIIDQVEDKSIRNLLRIAYGQLRAEYEFDRGWKKANLPDLIRLDKRVKELEAEEDHLWTKINKMTVVIKRMDARIEELEASIKPFAAYYVADCTNLDPDYCVICEADEEENNLTVGLFRAAYKVLEDK